jgi:hypothetical protein
MCSVGLEVTPNERAKRYHYGDAGREQAMTKDTVEQCYGSAPDIRSP